MIFDPLIVPLQLDKTNFDSQLAQVGTQAQTAETGLSTVGVVGTSALTDIAATAMTVVTAVVAIVTAIEAAAVAFVVAGVLIINQMSRWVSRTNEYGQQIVEIERLFADVKGAVYAAFSPLIEFAIPYIKLVVNWLVTMLNTVSMIVAALLGQKTVMQYIAGSADTVATATGRMAGNVTKAGQAAKGALASFDQLNVLQKASDTGTGGYGGYRSPMGEFKPVIVTPELAAQVATVKQWFIDLWNDIKVGASTAWGWVAGVWNTIASWFQLHVLNPLGQTFKSEWATISALVKNAWLVITLLWQPIANWFQVMILTPVENVFKKSWSFISGVILGIWPGIVTGIKGFINKIIDAINGMVKAVQSGLNSTITAMNKIGTKIPGWTLIPALDFGTIPHLAQGAIIPANNPFVAIMGEQKSGKNIEAPESLIRRIVKEETGNNQVTIRFDEGNLSGLMRVLKPYADKENARIGTSLITGGITA